MLTRDAVKGRYRFFAHWRGLKGADRCLTALFWLVMALRMAYPFIVRPQDWLHTDPLRHWKNGLRVLEPGLISGIDAKPYQLWLLFQRMLAPSEGSYLFSFFAGVLCALLPWLWYKAARELFDRRTSLLLGITIGVMPAFLAIYGFFMTETLLLNLLGLAFWMTLRSHRKQTLSSYAAALVCWLLAGLTRIVALPMAFLALVYLLLRLRRQRVAALLLTATCGAAAALPAGWHSYQAFGVFSPFHFSLPNQIYRLSGSEKYGYRTGGEKHHFACPSLYEDPFHPFRHYLSPRYNGQLTMFEVDVSKGVEDWQRKRDELRAAYDMQHFLEDLKDNFVYFLFGTSWPDLMQYRLPPDNSPFGFKMRTHMGLLGFHLRYLWAPLVVLVLMFAPFMRVNERRSLVLLITWCMLMLLLTQQTGVMEGRFRKPVEPLLLLSAVIILQALGVRDKGKGPQPALFYFGWRAYVLPVWDYLRSGAAFFVRRKQRPARRK